MGHFLFSNLRVLPILLAGFGLLSLARCRFEPKQLAINASITLVVWWVFIFSLFMLLMLDLMGEIQLGGDHPTFPSTGSTLDHNSQSDKFVGQP